MASKDELRDVSMGSEGQSILFGKRDKMEKLIENAYTSYRNCELSGSNWGLNYWSTVISSLSRESGRTN